MKGLGLRTTYFVEKYDPTHTEVKTLGQQMSLSEGSLSPANKRRTLEQDHNHSRSTCTVTKHTPTGSTSITASLWSAPNFSTHVGTAMCDNMPIAS